MSNEPIAVCISDIHFSLKTLNLASKALKAAIQKAEDLEVPVVIAGDLNDTKAILRAEVANALISILSKSKVKIYVLIGNHDLINEKGLEHSLNFLSPYATVVDKPTFFAHLPGWALIPYQNNTSYIIENLSKFKLFKGLIMHQGFMGASMGDYIQDKTSIDPEIVKDFTVISGHYHKHQTIGTVTYIGSPYTTTFGEANDGSKGFLILNSDGSFTREILELRRHYVFKRTTREIQSMMSVGFEKAFFGLVEAEDLIWLKVEGPYSELQKLDKKVLGEKLLGHSNFRLDLISTSSNEKQDKVRNLTDSEILDSIIDSLQESEEHKNYLKGLWNEIINS